MTILDMDKREKSCPVCGQARLVFITDAPKIRVVGKSVDYRCKACAIAEAEAAGDPLEVVQHRERVGLPTAWRADRRPPQPERLKLGLQKAKELLLGPNPEAPHEKCGTLDVAADEAAG